MSRKRPANNGFEAALESRVGKSSNLLSPCVFRALSFEEICSQARASCDDSNIEMGLGDEDKAGSPYTHLGSPFCVIPSFDDICALHGIANTTELENVKFTDMLSEETSSINGYGPSNVWLDVKNDILKDVEMKHERYQKVNTDAELQNHIKLVQEPVGDHGSTGRVTIKIGDSGATLMNEFHGDRKRAKTVKSTRLKEKCRKTINQKVIMKNNEKEVEVNNIDETCPDLQLPRLNKDEATHLNDAQSTIPELSRKERPETIHKDTENTDGKEVFTEHTGTTFHSKEIGPTSTESSAEKIENISPCITPIVRHRQGQRKRKIFSGQKLESICQKLMKMRDQKSSSPENLLSKQKHPLQITDNQMTSTDRIGEALRSIDHDRPKEEVVEENRKRSDDSQLMSIDTSSSNDATDHIADFSRPDEPLCDLFSSPTDSYHSITSTDTVDW